MATSSQSPSQSSPQSSSSQPPTFGEPMPTSVQPGSLGIVVVPDKKTKLGMKITEVKPDSQLKHILAKGDVVVEFDGFDLSNIGIGEFAKIVKAGTEGRMLTYRKILDVRVVQPQPTSDATSNSISSSNPLAANTSTSANSTGTTVGETSEGSTSSIGSGIGNQYTAALTAAFTSVNPLYSYPQSNIPTFMDTNTNINMNMNMPCVNPNEYANTTMNTNIYDQIYLQTMKDVYDKTTPNHYDNDSNGNGTYNDQARASFSLPSSTSTNAKDHSADQGNGSAPNELQNKITLQNHQLPKVTPDQPSKAIAITNNNEKGTTHLNATGSANSTSATSSSSSSDDKIKKFEYMHKCDICDMCDGYRGMYMQRCKQCGIYVHEECYGLLNEYHKTVKFPDWQCWACLSVGKTITLQNKDDDTQQRILIQTRPVQCALCPCKTGFHAMHPLYDKHERDGQPVVTETKDKTLRTVWVHTVCALFICSYELTKGLVYGCNEIGGCEYRNDNSEDDENNQQGDVGFSRHYPFSHVEKNQEVLTASPHHFVILSKEGGAGDAEVQKLKEIKELKCFLCHNPDQHSRRIAVQCMDQTCSVTCHVGCAKWSTDYKLLSFFPGNETDDDHMEFCCNKHSKSKHNPIKRKGKKDKKQPSGAVNVDKDEGLFDVEETDYTSRRRKTEYQVSTDHPDQTTTGTSKYYEKKRLLEETLENMVSDLQDAIKRAKTQGDDLKLVMKRRKDYWNEFGGLGKKDFKELWDKCETRVAEYKKSRILAPEYQQKLPGDLKRQRSNDGETLELDENNDGNPKQKKTKKNRWLKLFVPYYDEDEKIDLYDESFYKSETITQSDMENEDDEGPIDSF